MSVDTTDCYAQGKVESLEGRLARQSRGYVSGKMGTGKGVRGRRRNY